MNSLSNLLIFDGDCLFCNWIAFHLAKADKRDFFKFVSNTSELGEKIIRDNDLQYIVNQSVIIMVDNRFYTKSTAVYQFLKTAKLYPFLQFLIKITPSFIANYVYDIISKNRKKIIQKECPILPPEIRQKFL